MFKLLQNGKRVIYSEDKIEDPLKLPLFISLLLFQSVSSILFLGTMVLYDLVHKYTLLYHLIRTKNLIFAENLSLLTFGQAEPQSRTFCIFLEIF